MFGPGTPCGSGVCANTAIVNNIKASVVSFFIEPLKVYPHNLPDQVSRCCRQNSASANQLDDADNRISRPATCLRASRYGGAGRSGMRDPLAPQLGRPHANDAVVGPG